MFGVVPELIIFCPLPPKPNGIADYLAEQLPYFSQRGLVCVVIEDSAPEVESISESVLILRLQEYLAVSAKYTNVPHMYHVGNNPDTVYMLPVLLNRPGIVVIHDLNLHYLIDLTNLTRGDKLGYERALFNQYGSAGKLIGHQLAEFGWKGKHMSEQLMMNESVIHAASEIIVHSKYSKDYIEAMGYKNVQQIPHHLSPEIRHHQVKLKMNYRGILGLPGNKPIITSMGFIAKAKQIKSVLASLAELKAQGISFLYVLAGQCKQHEYDVFQDIADYGLQDDVIVTGFLSNEAFFQYLIASDFVVNLRYPTGGESSGTLTRALGLGLACIVVNIGPFAEIPGECALKLDYDESFQSNLTSALKMLIENPQARTEMGLAARRWVERTHGISATTADYYAVVLKERDRLACSSVNVSGGQLSANVAAAFDWLIYPSKETIDAFSLDWDSGDGWIAGILWWKNRFLPECENNRLLVSSDNPPLIEIAERAFGYDQNSRVEKSLTNILESSVAELNGRADRLLIILPIESVAQDPVSVFVALNGDLELGAVGVISIVWQSEEPFSIIPLDRNAMIVYLESAGFSVERYITGDADIELGNSSSNEQQAFLQEWAFAVRKCSNMVNRAPQPQYNGQLSKLEYIRPSDTSFGGQR